MATMVSPVWLSAADPTHAMAHAAKAAAMAARIEKIEGPVSSMRNRLETAECCAELGRVTGRLTGSLRFPMAINLVSMEGSRKPS
jgi:hypothetical protein